MSVKTELEEMLKWISDLLKEKESEPTRSASREAWQHVDQRLRAASKKFAEARVLLSETRIDVVPDTDPRLIILATVLRRRSSRGRREKTPAGRRRVRRRSGARGQALALRARLLSRRARKGKPQRFALDLLSQPLSKAKPDKPKPPPTAPEPESPKDLVQDAGGTIETAHSWIADVAEHPGHAVAHPDAVTKAFEEDLDVLAEMTLSLRQQCEEEERKEAERKEKPSG